MNKAQLLLYVGFWSTWICEYMKHINTTIAKITFKFPKCRINKCFLLLNPLNHEKLIELIPLSYLSPAIFLPHWANKPENKSSLSAALSDLPRQRGEDSFGKGGQWGRSSPFWSVSVRLHQQTCEHRQLRRGRSDKHVAARTSLGAHLQTAAANLRQFSGCEPECACVCMSVRVWLYIHNHIV